MYGHANYGPQFIHGPPPPPPPLQQGHPPPPPIPLQQGPPLPHPPLQHVPPAPLPPIQQGPPPPPPPIQQGHAHPVHINPPRMMNMAQPYFSPPIPGRTQVPPSYSTTQQNHPYPLPMALQNVHLGQPPRPPFSGPSPPEMTPGQLPPRVLPPPLPSQGQMLYRTPPMPLNSGILQVPQPVRPLPPPSGFVPITPPPYPSFVHEHVSDAHPPSMPPPPPPPPPPSSPPPLPPSPPPPISPPPNLPSMVSDGASLNSINSRCLESSVGPADFVEKIIDSADVAERYIDPPCDTVGSAQSVGGTSQMVDSIVAGESSSKAPALKDSPAPPPKPQDEEVSRNIELLCQFIAKAGPEFEKMARTREAGNQKFAFLFGGEPGSDAATGYEYFEWMKKKYPSKFRLQDESEQIDPSLRVLELESSPQFSNLVDERLADSPDASDMDMEDDVNPSSRGPEVAKSYGDLEGELASPNNGDIDAKEQFHSPESPSRRSIPEVAVASNVSWTGSSLHAEQGKANNSTSPEGDDDSASAMPFIEDLSPVSISPEVEERTSNGIVQKSSMSHTQVSTPVRAAPASAEVLGSSNKDASLFKLIPDYASDDSADDDEGPYIEDVSPVRVSPVVTVCASDVGPYIEDVGTHPHSGLASMNLPASGTDSALKIGSDVVDPSIMPPKIVETTQDSVGSPASHKAASPSLTRSELLDFTAETKELGTRGTPDKPFINDSFEGNAVDVGPGSGRVHQEDDLKQVSPKLVVDEFGRLVKEACSDSESDVPPYPERRRQRGRSRSRSRSPLESRRRRSRSPRKRRDKRSRSCSWSPKKQRSRSKSPAAYRRPGEYVGEKSRWDRNQTPACFNFIRGRCYRGASCRFLHRDYDRDDASRWHRGKVQQHQESPREFRNSVVDTEESKNVAVEKDYSEKDALYLERISTEIQPAQELSVGGDDAKMDVDLEGKPESISVRDNSQTIISSELGQAPVTEEAGQSQGSQETIVRVQEPHQVQQLQEEPNINSLANEISQQSVEIPQPSSVNTFPIQLLPITEIPDLPVVTPVTQPYTGEASHASDSGPVLQNVPPYLKPVEGSLVSHPFPVQTYPAATFHGQDPPAQQYLQNQGSVNQPLQFERFGSQTFPPREFHPSIFSSGDFRFHPPQVSVAPQPPPANNLNPQLPSDYQLQPPAGNFQSWSAPIERVPPHQPPPADYHSQHPPPNPSWTNLPPPPPNPSWANLPPPPPNPSWTNLPPPPPPPPFRNEMPPKPSISATDLQPLPVQKNPTMPRNDFPPQPLMRPYLPEDLSHSSQLHPGDFRSRTFPPIVEPYRTSLPMEEFRSRLLPVENLHDQPFGGSGFMREERFSGPTGDPQSFSRSKEDFRLLPHLLLREEVRVDPFPFREDPQKLSNSRFSSQLSSQGFTSTAFDPNLRDNLPTRTFPSEDYSLVTSSQFAAPGNIESSRAGYQAGLPASVSSVRSHFNPFASTFEKTPASSAFSSGVFRHEIEAISGSKRESQFVSTHVSAGGQGNTGVGSRTLGLPQSGSPPDSGRFGGKFFPRSGSPLPISPSGEPSDILYPREPSAARQSGEPLDSVKESAAGDQYDPLFDSIEPSSNEVIRKFDRVQEREASIEATNKSVAAWGENDLGITVRPSILPKPMDVDENNKQIEGVPAVFKPSENDEFGEVAIDGKMGAVDNGSPLLEDGKNWSPGHDVDLGNTAAGEIEIDQVPIPGKSKKSKDSRSMKLFKIALADFVKEVLKPSWRQGNMSKEAFKTIVKKTVDKVSGAMQGHQIPKTQGKINQYVESSQRKLTKLVMGYVDKYVKA